MRRWRRISTLWYNITPMEVKPTDLLKVLQKAHEKEPAKVEVPVAPVEEGHGGLPSEEIRESRAAQPDLFGDHQD